LETSLITLLVKARGQSLLLANINNLLQQDFDVLQQSVDQYFHDWLLQTLQLVHCNNLFTSIPGNMFFFTIYSCVLYAGSRILDFGFQLESYRLGENDDFLIVTITC